MIRIFRKVKAVFLKKVCYPFKEVRNRSMRKDETVFSRRGRSVLGGRNIGRYPVHDYRFFREAEPFRNWPLYVRSAGSGIWIRGCSRVREYSDSFSVELVTRGEFRFSQFGAEHRLKEGELCLVQLGTSSEMWCDTDEPAEKLFIALSGPLLPVILRSGKLDKMSVFRPEDPGWFRARFESAMTLLGTKPDGFARAASELAYEVLLALWSGRSREEYPEILTRVLRFMEEEISRPLGVEEICRKFRLSPVGLFRLFRKHIGISPINYLIRRRIEFAEELLLLSTYSIKEIADRVGYPNAHYFSGEFRRVTGMSPREYRGQNPVG